MVNQKDYYKILNITQDADKKTIKGAYKKAALKYHPDINKDPGAEEKFKELTEAYAVLSDDTKREKYDNNSVIIEKYSQEDLIKTIDLDKIFKGINYAVSLEKEHGIISGLMGLTLGNPKNNKSHKSKSRSHRRNRRRRR
jgi:molecular chaperone DnaJ